MTNAYDKGCLNLPFVGISTFGKNPYQPDWSKIDADFAILGAPFDFGTQFRAGARFGHLAAGSPLALQQVLAQGVAAQDLLPEVRDLPEFLPWREFQRRYGDPGSAAYRQQMARIEARIASLPLAARAAAQAQR